MPGRVAIHLPVFQRFDCQSCGYCCRNLIVNVTKAERKRIVDAGWIARIRNQLLFKGYRFRGRRLYRLAKHPDGRCVFLGDDERCRLHAESGQNTKPLACRLYPFVLTPGADSVRVDMRFDCPAVASNQGRSLTVHQKSIVKLAREIGPTAMKSLPAWPSARPLSIKEFKAIATSFEGLLREQSLPMHARLRAGCQLLDLLYSVNPRKVRDERFVELMSMLTDAAADEARQDEADAIPAPSKRTDRLFRQWLFLHAVTDAPEQLDASFAKKMVNSWRRYSQARRFSAGTGPVPLITPEAQAIEFETIQRVAAADNTMLEPLCRSLWVKLEAHAFAGPGYFNYDLISGLTALWLLPALVGWFARLSAASASRGALEADDVLTGLRHVHHTFGISPVFARISEKLRMRALARPGLPAALLAEYGP